MTNGGHMVSDFAGGPSATRAGAPPRKTAFITGATGQDGSFLIELLRQFGYRVVVLVRRVAHEDFTIRLGRIGHLQAEVEVVSGDLLSLESLCRLVSAYPIDECYHLGAQSFVSESFL